IAGPGQTGLPPGLTLSPVYPGHEAVIDGTPTEAGTFTFTVQSRIEDASGASGSDTQVMTIVVDPPTARVVAAVSVSSGGEFANTPIQQNPHAENRFAITPNGRFVVFVSDASN